MRYCLLLLIALISCNAPQQSEQSNSSRSVIYALMDEQEKAWNNGDLESFMSAYWNSDSLMFVGSRGLNYGWSKTLSNYQKSYPDKEAMGQLEFENLAFKDLDDTKLVIGLWTLYRSSDTLSGSYSLTWRKLENQWKIVADHSSSGPCE